MLRLLAVLLSVAFVCFKLAGITVVATWSWWLCAALVLIVIALGILPFATMAVLAIVGGIGFLAASLICALFPSRKRVHRRSGNATTGLFRGFPSTFNPVLRRQVGG